MIGVSLSTLLFQHAVLFKIPGTTEEETCRSAEVDWLRDTRRWGGKMPKEAFFSSMFELADIWTENIDEEEVPSAGLNPITYTCFFPLSSPFVEFPSAGVPASFTLATSVLWIMTTA